MKTAFSLPPSLPVSPNLLLPLNSSSPGTEKRLGSSGAEGRGRAVGSAGLLPWRGPPRTRHSGPGSRPPPRPRGPLPCAPLGQSRPPHPRRVTAYAPGLAPPGRSASRPRIPESTGGPSSRRVGVQSSPPGTGLRRGWHPRQKGEQEVPAPPRPSPQARSRWGRARPPSEAPDVAGRGPGPGRGGRPGRGRAEEVTLGALPLPPLAPAPDRALPTPGLETKVRIESSLGELPHVPLVCLQ